MVYAIAGIAAVAVVIAVAVFTGKKDKSALTIEAYDLKSFLRRVQRDRQDQEAEEDPALKEAVEYLAKIENMFMEGRWDINQKEHKVTLALFNRTDSAIDNFVVKFDIMKDDSLIEKKSFRQNHVPSHQEATLKCKYVEDKSAKEFITDSISSLVLRGPKYTVTWTPNPYTFQINASNPMYNNPYIRKLAGAAPLETKSDASELQEEASPIDALLGSFDDEAKELSEVLQLKCDDIWITLEKIREYCDTREAAQEKFNKFVIKFLPTLIGSMHAYNIIKANNPSGEEVKEAEKSLDHTLSVFKTSTDNYMRKLMQNVALSTSVEQDVLEQQMIREGLYDPYEG